MQIPLLGSNVSGRSLNQSAMSRLNCYLEIEPEGGDKSRVVAYGIPGRDLFVDFGDAPVRGWHAVGNFLYVVHRGTFYEVNNAGIAVSRGTLTTTVGMVSIDDNGVEIFIADGVTKGWVYNLATLVFTLVTDADAVISDVVTFLDGYFIVNKKDSGQFNISDLYAGLSWPATGFALAEADPDKLIAPIAERGVLGLFGAFTTELWSNVGTLPFPFARIQGMSQEWGLAARHSLRKFDRSLIYLGRNRLGEISVLHGLGGEVQRVSPPDLDFIINRYASPEDAVGCAYMHNGHPFYQLSFRAAERSWLYDGKSGVWSVLKSFGLERDSIELAEQYLGKTRFTDFSRGKIYTLNTHNFTDNGASIPFELVTGHVYSADYDNLAMHELRLDMEAGVGLATGQGEDPQIMLSISRDGGHTYGVERWKAAGKIGEFCRRAAWRRLTLSRDSVFKLRITEPVKKVLLGAALIGSKGDA